MYEYYSLCTSKTNFGNGGGYGYWLFFVFSSKKN